MAEPSGPIQTFPRGLIGLLQLKSRGQMPDVLQGTVQPTVDLMQLWLNAGQAPDTVLHARAIGAGNGGFWEFSPNAILVPQNEIWYVHHYTVRVAIPAGATEQTRSFAPAMGVTQVGTILYQVLAAPQTFDGVAGVAVTGYVRAGGFWLGPGQSLGFVIGNVATATTHVFVGDVLATRMPIP